MGLAWLWDREKNGLQLTQIPGNLNPAKIRMSAPELELYSNCWSEENISLLHSAPQCGNYIVKI